MSEPCRYLDPERLNAVETDAFRRSRPYPWVSLKGTLTDAAYERLRATLPDVHLFSPLFGVARAHGQQSHDRYALEYRPGVAVADPWHELVRELQGPLYRRFLRRLTGQHGMQLRFHWHYTPTGCSVSPHCDARHKIGSHIFYFNTEADWDPTWGGETLILDDGGRFERRSAPAFSDFTHVVSAPALGNQSLLFMRRASSWHGVREIHCPPDAYRKVFIVVLNHWTTPIRSWWRGRPATGDY